MQKYVLLLFFVFAFFGLSAQYLPESPYNKAIEDYIDELASAGVITVNGSIKPYSRHQIVQWLNEANAAKTELNKRQQKELEFYLTGYQLYNPSEIIPDNKLSFSKNPLGFQYRDSLFRLSIHPLLSGTLLINDSATIQNRIWGASLYGSIGKNFAFYTVLSDHWETQPLGTNQYLTLHEGGKYKAPKDYVGGEYSTIRGGVTWNWKWGQAGFIYDRFIWGTGYHGTNLFSGRTPPFPQITLKIKPVKWFEFNYVHAWLASEIIDSTRSFTSANDYKRIYYPKYVATSMYSIMPWKFLRFSVGNSIIYTSRHAYPGFLIPNLFYRSVDENFASINNNSQLFFDLSIRPVKGLHLYSSLIVDDFRLNRIKSSVTYNLYSFKAGFRTSSLFAENVIITGEYTKTTPIMYKHKMSILTFATNNYSLGHYLRDNSQELFGQIEWKPVRGTTIFSNYTLARHGNEYEYITDDGAVSYPVMKDEIWKNQSFKIGAFYELFTGTILKASVLFSNITGSDADGQTAQYWVNRFTPPYLRGKQVTLEGGFSIGF